MFTKGYMKITFVYPDLIGSADYKGIFYIGIASLSSFLRARGHKTSLIHIVQPIDEEKMAYIFKNDDADLYALSCTANMFPYIKKCTRIIKDQIDKPVVIGGVYPTLCPAKVIEERSIDYVCQGEGEYPLFDLCEAIQNGEKSLDILNIWGRDKEARVVENKMRPLIDNLDILPFPDREIYENFPNLMNEREGFTTFMASRGCPYDCTYCCNHALKNTFEGLGRYVRFRTVDSVIQEIKYTAEKYSFLKEFAFEDDILPLNKDWFEEFAEKYKKEIGIPFRCNTRPDILDQNVITLLKYAGCWKINIGIETGSEYIRTEILNRNISDKKIYSVSSLCKENNISLFTFNILGLPFETCEDMLETIKINARLKSSFSQCTIFYPYEKTKLYQICLEEKLLSNQELKDYYTESSLNYRHLTSNRIKFFTYYFRLLVFFYSQVFALSGILKIFVEKLLDSILSSPLTGYCLFPFFNDFYISMRSLKLSAKIGHFFKRKIRLQKKRKNIREI